VCCSNTLSSEAELGRQGLNASAFPHLYLGHARRFPPPWTIEEYRDISYIVRNANNFPGKPSEGASKGPTDP
jgi:hypothetical protein